MLRIFTIGLVVLWPALVFSNPTKVKVVNATVVDIYDLYEGVGECRSLLNQNFISQVNGTVTWIYNSTTPQITAGQVLLEIDGPKARAEYKVANLAFNRDTALFKKGIVSEGALDKAKADFEKASEEYRNRIIKAPFDGKIGVIKYHIGDIVSSGDELLSITGTNNAKDILVNLPLNTISYVNTETKALVVDHDKELDAKIMNISTNLSESTGSFSAKITLTENNNLHSGEYVKVKLILNPHKAITVPAKAIMNNNKGPFVFIVNKDNIVEQKQITNGTRFGNLVEAKSGLVEGDQVVIEGLTKVVVGDSVEPIK